MKAELHLQRGAGMQYNRSKKSIVFLIGFFFKRAYPSGEVQHVCVGPEGDF